ncbi:MAG TPA: hypothetical protein VHS59_12020 [Bacillota bacterium]|nr:hypothetical protein [Bacillota bacterium]
MQVDSSILLSLAMSLGLLLTISWIGFNLINNQALGAKMVIDTPSLVARIVRQQVAIRPRFRQILIVRRLIKSSTDNDEKPHFLPQYCC